jgi:hypothetical protein
MLCHSKFEDKTIKWNTKTTIYKNGNTHGHNTFNDTKNYNGFKNDDENSEEEIEEPQQIIKRHTFNEIKQWFNNNLKNKGYGTGPKLKHPDENNFYTCITQFDKIYKIRSIEEFNNYEKTKNWGFRGKTLKSKEKNKYRVYPVYKDISNPESLEWWLIYYA